MATISETLAIAFQLHQAGRLRDAEQIYRQILQADPNQADALHCLGLIAYQVGKHGIAVEYIGRAIASNGNAFAFHGNLGNVLKDQGKLEEAGACYRRALELRPDYAELHYNLGSVLRDQGKLEEAVVCYRQALALKPDYADAHNNLGNALKNQGKLEDAVDCYRRALQLKPDHATAHNNLGLALQDQGKLKEASDCYRRALQLKSDYVQADNNLGLALQGQGKLEEAVACYRRALHLHPGMAEAHNNLANALKDQGKLEEAVACYRRALHLQSDHAVAHNNLGLALQNQLKLAEAVACYHRALELKPDEAMAHSNLGTALLDQGKLEEAIVCYNRALALKPDYVAAHDNLLQALQYRPGVTPAALAEAHAEYDRRHAAPLRRAVAPHDRVSSRHGPLRLGFVSPNLGRHPVGYFLVRVLENLNQRPHRVVCYSDRIVKDSLTQRLQAAATQWRDVKQLSDEQLAEQILADEIDILFDLAGHTGHNRLLVFARKPAPIQITWIGYEGTTGLAEMDYLLADHHVVPEGSDQYYREQLLRMPDGYLCYDPPADAPPVGPPPSLRNGYATFGSFNNLAKITPEVVAAWAEILRRAPTARLVFKYYGLSDQTVKRRYLDLFAAHGVEPRRLDLLPSSPYVEYLATCQQVDVALDSFPFSGSATTCEALWMGVPVVTCPGETFAGRHTLSHLSNVGLTETVAGTLEEYIELAVSLARNLPRLAGIRARLRQQMTASPLCDGPRFAANLMRLLHEIWQQKFG